MKNKVTEQKKVNSNKPKVEIPGQFQTDYQGRIINNRCNGIDPSEYSWEKLFRKTAAEKVATATVISKYNQLMTMYYGKNWRSRKGAAKVSNVPFKLNKQTQTFELIK
jgi:hypothetical protein